MKLAIASSERSREDTCQVFISFIRYFRRYCREQGIEVLAVDSDKIPKLLENRKAFDVLFGMRACGLPPSYWPYYKKWDIKTIVFWDDLHWFNERALQGRICLFKNSDLLLLPYYDHFLKIKEYEPFRRKAIEFLWFAPMECFNASEGKPWPDRQDRVFLSGRCTDPYTFRKKIYDYGKGHPDLYHILKHPGYKDRSHEVIGALYYETMAEYKAAIATSADKPLDYLLCKYFEIPACGCLPLFEEVPYLQKAGFIPGVHYIPIGESFSRKITSDLIRSGQQIASEAQRFVREKHSAEARAKELLEILLAHFKELSS